MAAGENRIGRRGVGLGLKEIIECAYGSQPPVNGGHGVAEFAALGEVDVYVLQAGVRVGRGTLARQGGGQCGW